MLYSCLVSDNNAEKWSYILASFYRQLAESCAFHKSGGALYYLDRTMNPAASTHVGAVEGSLYDSILQDFVFPEDVAYPIGGENGHKFLVLEIHYDNQQMIEGVVDNSGLEFFYSNEEPLYRAGLLNLGHVSMSSLIIPPGADNYVVNGYCPGTCTDRVSFVALSLSQYYIHLLILSTVLSRDWNHYFWKLPSYAFSW